MLMLFMNIKISHLSLLNMLWFTFENVYVFCLTQNNIENRFFILLYSTALFFILELWFENLQAPYV
jgi:hypothetical protein